MYIDKQKVILDKDTEYKHFIRCYEIFLDALPVLKDRDNQAEDLARELVYNPEKYVFYKDARPFLEANKSYKMAVVSDAWPSLRDVFMHADYTKYFDSMVISSEIGVCKPSSMMYQQALTDLNLKPDEVIFVDDRPKNCLGAEKLGIKSYLLSRHWSNYLVHKFKYRQLTVINSLIKITNL
nr:HAD-IA family hydrolase [Acidaminobacter sp. JC074]